MTDQLIYLCFLLSLVCGVLLAVSWKLLRVLRKAAGFRPGSRSAHA